MVRSFSLVLGFACFLVLLACDAAVATEGSSVSEDETTAVTASFGEQFDASSAIPAPELMMRYSEEELVDTVRVTLRGEVNEVCQAKGCWMTVRAQNDEEVMVKFKDYAYFVPKDIGGREVVMNGMAYYQITPVEELRHYAEDAGKAAAEIAMITEPERELRFLADGVQLLGE